MAIFTAIGAIVSGIASVFVGGGLGAVPASMKLNGRVLKVDDATAKDSDA